MRRGFFVQLYCTLDFNVTAPWFEVYHGSDITESVIREFKRDLLLCEVVRQSNF